MRCADSLERTTDIEDVFPDRAETDRQTGRKRWLAVDFTLAEIKRLDAGSWFDQNPDEDTCVLQGGQHKRCRDRYRAATVAPPGPPSMSGLRVNIV